MWQTPDKQKPFPAGTRTLVYIPCVVAKKGGLIKEDIKFRVKHWIKNKKAAAEERMKVSVLRLM